MWARLDAAAAADWLSKSPLWAGDSELDTPSLALLEEANPESGEECVRPRELLPAASPPWRENNFASKGEARMVSDAPWWWPMAAISAG